MKKLFYLVLICFLVQSSCNCGNDKDLPKGQDDKIIEIGTSNNNQQNQEKLGSSEDKQSEIQLDSKFAAFLARFKKVNLPYKIEPELDLNLEKIPFELQTDYLLKAEGLDKSELDHMQDYAKFYYFSNPVSSDKYNAIVYARSEMGSSYYILCTFDNQGKLISFIDFAMHQVIGAGPQAGQEYVMTGSIDKDLMITTVADATKLKYQIQEDGKIIKK
jgi:hypothetical protein